MNAELIKALREDAERAYANEWETPITLGDHLDAAAAALEAADKRIAGLEAAQRWISVKDRMPEDDLPDAIREKRSMIRCILTDGKLVFAGSREKYRSWGWNRCCNITHWQPLPLPPQKG